MDAKGKVERYTVVGDIAYPIHEDPDGNYVAYDDYAALLSELDRLRGEVAGLREDAARLDWLADVNNTAGQVLLPSACVEANIHSLRAAIDAAIKESANGQG